MTDTTARGFSDTVAELSRRFKGATPEMIQRVLTPYRLPITSIGSEVIREKNHQYVLFEASIPEDMWSPLEKGASGKVVSKDYVHGDANWKELMNEAYRWTFTIFRRTSPLRAAIAAENI